MSDTERRVSATPEEFKRLIAAVLDEKSEPEKKPEADIPLWVKIFGPTLLVVVTTIVIGVFQFGYGKITDIDLTLRNFMERAVKVEDYNSRNQTQWNAVRELQANTPKLLATEEKVKSVEANLTKLEAEVKGLVAENAKLRERIAALEKKPAEKSEEKP